MFPPYSSIQIPKEQLTEYKKEQMLYSQMVQDEKKRRKRQYLKSIFKHLVTQRQFQYLQQKLYRKKPSSDE